MQAFLYLNCLCVIYFQIYIFFLSPVFYVLDPENDKKRTYKQILEAYLYSFVYTSNPTYVSVCGEGMYFECVCVSC